MKTGKLIIDPAHPYQKRADKKSSIPVTFYKNTGNNGEKFHPENKDNTRLQEISLMNRTYFGAIFYDIHLEIKSDYTVSRIFQEMSLSELQTLHNLCEFERAQILQWLALAVLKITYVGHLLSNYRSKLFIDHEGKFLWY